MRKRNCLLLLFVFFTHPVWSQYCRKYISFNNDTVQLEHKLIQASSIELKSNNTQYKQPNDYVYLPFSNQLVNRRIPKNQTLELGYFYSTYALNEQFRLRDKQLLHAEIKNAYNPFAIDESQPQFKINAHSEGIQTTGSMMRGFVFGNGMNANVNANLNLQLSGKLQNDVQLLAAISDDNNPIQPEGNTRNIQDFDQVFVQFSKDAHQVILGDYLMTKNQDIYFLNYNKKSRGLHLETAFQLSPKSIFKTQADLAISRGRFVRNAMNGIEGNQGPYRLTGPNGEMFIIVISGTEAVYLNGERLTRGEQNDYIIDYNSGEITFMPKRLIQSFSRIVVEFQYSDRNYARTLYNQVVQVNKGKSTYSLQFYSEQDNKNQPFQQALSEKDIALLQSVGNHTEQALVSGVSGPFIYNASKIQYKQIDSLGNKGIFVYANTPSVDTVFFEVKFSYLGANKGNYIQGKSMANGRVFQWVSPVNGVPQGDFEPLIKLIAPTQRQMLTASYKFADAKGNVLQLDLAGSNDDKNTFSSFNNDKNLGFAFRLNAIQKQFQLFKNVLLTQQLSSEITNSQFNSIERYRSVEFARIWQRQLNNSTALQNYGDQLYAYQLVIDISRQMQFQYQVSKYLKEENQFNGIQHIFKTQFHYHKFEYNGSGEYLNAAFNLTGKNNLFKLENELKKDFKFVQLGYKWSHEKSMFIWKNDSIAANSFAYQQHQFALQNSDTSHFKSIVEASYRIDELPIVNQMQKTSEAYDLKTNLTVFQNNGNQFRLDIAFRDFYQNNIAQKEQTLLTRIEYDYGFWKRIVTANTYFQTAGASELKRDFQFVEVPIGMGVYVWKDLNKNGNAELNEFLQAGLTEKNTANYIKVFLPSSTLVPVQSNLLNQTINLHHFTNSKNSWFYRFSNQTAYRFEQKKLQEMQFSWDRFLPISAQDTQLMSMNTLLRNTLFYNKTLGVFGMDYTYLQNQTKLLQTNGSDYRKKTEQLFNFRFNLNETWTLLSSFTTGNKQYFSSWINNNNFNFNYVEFKPKLNYQFKQSLRLSALYAYTQAQNHEELNEDAAKIQEFSAEFRFAIPKSGSFFAKYSHIEVAYIGNTSSILAYEILQGLGNGKNQVWTLQWQHRLGGNIQINFVYDGRIPANLPVVHIGKMEARYVF